MTIIDYYFPFHNGYFTLSLIFFGCMALLNFSKTMTFFLPVFLLFTAGFYGSSDHSAANIHMGYVIGFSIFFYSLTIRTVQIFIVSFIAGAWATSKLTEDKSSD